MTTQTEADALRVEAHCTVAVEPEAAFSAFRGRVVEWNPPTRLVLHWGIGPDRVPCPDTPSRVTVGFHLDGDSTRVAVVHDLFEAHGDAGLAYAEAMRSEQGWPHLLEQFAAPLKQ